MKKRRIKSRETDKSRELHTLETGRRFARKVIVEYICDGDPESFAGAMLANTIRHEEDDVAPATFNARGWGITMRGDFKGWRILHRRRVLFSGKTFEEFLAEFFPDGTQPPSPSPST
jgi:hypothetical protein